MEETLELSGEKLRCKYDILDLSLGFTADFVIFFHLFELLFSMYKTEQYNKILPFTFQGSVESQGRKH